MNDDDFRNRLVKRDRHLRKWAARWPTDAYRVYDWDIPEWAFAVDRYGDHVHLQAFSKRRESAQATDERTERAAAVVADALGVDPDHIHGKHRRRQKGSAQYEKRDVAPEVLWVHEGPYRFRVDLEQYLDTGLFLDHRETRRMVGDEVEARGAGCRVLNLFSYTGAFSVWAAGAGAAVTTVDLSNTYLDWAGENFRANDLPISAPHRFERSDVMRWLPQEHMRGGRYDAIVLDPPTFSRSKKMVRDLDVQRDHPELIRGAVALLADGGTLWFSTNFRDFELRNDLGADLVVEEMTDRTIPEDFRAGIHRSWRIRRV